MRFRESVFKPFMAKGCGHNRAQDIHILWRYERAAGGGKEIARTYAKFRNLFKFMKRAKRKEIARTYGRIGKTFNTK
jgi:hypothetical protein